MSIVSSDRFRIYIQITGSYHQVVGGSLSAEEKNTSRVEVERTELFRLDVDKNTHLIDQDKHLSI